jgi:hypothetical protein
LIKAGGEEKRKFIHKSVLERGAPSNAVVAEQRHEAQKKKRYTPIKLFALVFFSYILVPNYTRMKSEIFPFFFLSFFLSFFKMLK